MKRNGLKEAVALAVCACALAGTAATAQVSAGWSSSNAVQNSLSASSGYSAGSGSMSSEGLRASDGMASQSIGGAFVINRFGMRDGRIVAYGRLVPTSGIALDANATTGSMMTRSGLLLSSPAEPAGGYGADPRLGMGSRIAYSDVIVSGPSLTASTSSSSNASSSSSSLSLGSASSSASSIGATTYGVNSSFDESRLGNWTGIGTGYGESGVESRSNMTHDIDGTTSFNLGRPYDDQSYMEDITWGGHSSMNDDLAYSTDQEMLGDFEFGATSGNDRTSVDLQMGPTSGNDRTSLGVDLRADSRPLVQLGGSAGLYSSAEAERALMLGASEDIAIPVSVVSASCDAVSLSFADGAETVTVSSASGDSRLGSTLCALSEASSVAASEGQQAMLVKHLNRLISRVD
jgi:hypothetical protein